MPTMIKAFAMTAAVFAAATSTVSRAAESAAPSSYGSAVDYFGVQHDEGHLSVDEYFDALHTLTQQFDSVCGDTFCEGDYSNLTSLSFDCSVEQSSGAVGQCVWAFAGTVTDIEPATGKLAITKKVFVCDLGIKGSATEFSGFLRKVAAAGTDGFTGLRAAKVPGTHQDLMTILGSCL